MKPVEVELIQNHEDNDGFMENMAKMHREYTDAQRVQMRTSFSMSSSQCTDCSRVVTLRQQEVECNTTFEVSMPH